MLNILTTEYKNRLTSDYRNRRAVVVLSLIFILLAICFFFSFSLYLISSLKNQSVASGSNKIISGVELDKFRELKRDLTKLNANSLLVLSSSRPILFGAFLDKILKNQPAGLKIDSVQLDYSSDKKSIVGNISGLASDRQLLIDFVGVLKQDQTFSSVDYPVANLIEGNDSRFNVSLEIPKKQNGQP